MVDRQFRSRLIKSPQVNLVHRARFKTTNEVMDSQLTP